MGLAYYGSRISPNMTKTTENYLICLNVPIARTGKQDYLAKEIGLTDRNPDDIVEVIRSEEEVFSPATIASFEGKPFTDDHPYEDVDVNNYEMYSKGHCQNVHRGTGENYYNLMADVYVTNPATIKEIENGKRQISCGYICDYVPDEDGTYRQVKIRGNHVALVEEGRAGKSVSIKDSKIKERRVHEMGTTISGKIKSVLNLLARSVKDSKSVDDTDAMVSDATNAIEELHNTAEKVLHKDVTDGCEVEKKVEVKDEMPNSNVALKNALLTASLALNEAIAYLGEGKSEQAPALAPAQGPAQEVKQEPVPVTQKPSDVIEQNNANTPDLTPLPNNETDDVETEVETEAEQSEEPLFNEEDEEKDVRAMDELYEELKEKKEEVEDEDDEEDYEEAEVVEEDDDEDKEVEEDVFTEDEPNVIEAEEEVKEGYTKDSMAKFVKDMKPIIAKISNDRERAMVSNMFAKTFRKATSDANSIARIMQANEEYAKSMTNDSKPFTYEDQQAVFDKLNPHLKK